MKVPENLRRLAVSQSKKKKTLDNGGVKILKWNINNNND